DHTGQRAQDLSRARRRALARRGDEARCHRLLAGGDAVEPRFCDRRHVVGQRAWLAGAVWAVRRDGALVPADAGGRVPRHLLAYRPASPQPKPLPPPDYSGAFGFLSRRLFRAQTGSEAAKKRRWYAESVLAAKLATGKVTRNTLLNYPVAALADSDSSRTDI